MIEDAYIIKGGKPLRGTVQLSGSKNIALKTLIAALMFESEVVLKRIPHINDVEDLIHLIRLLGAKAEWEGKNEVRIDGRGMSDRKVDLLHGSKIRVSFMLFAPLLLRFGEAYIPNPGGCRIGARPIDRIVAGMQAIGIEVSYDSGTGYYHAVKSGPLGGTFRFDKPSHTTTELLIMIAMMASSEVVLENAALEPEIDDLIAFLNEAGADIVREGNSIRIQPTHRLAQNKPYEIAADRNEAVTYAVLAHLTKGEITIEHIPRFYIQTFIDELTKIGGHVEEKSPNSFTVSYREGLHATHIETAPHPGFMTDWQPLWAILMTQATGLSVIHERIFENRFNYAPELCKLGADIEFCDIEVADPQAFYLFNIEADHELKQAIQINGPKTLHNGVVTISDLRAGATLAVAALSAPGESVVHRVSTLERGYERFVEKVRSLGGDIRKV